MRTTITLDDDLARAIERRRRHDGRTFKDEINELLRVGLLTAEQDLRPPSPGLAVGPWNGGELLIGSIDDVAGALAAAEGEAFR